MLKPLWAHAPRVLFM